MTGFTDVFGGSTVQAADVSYRAVALTASATTVWPQYATSSNQMARLMDVTASSAGYSLATPDATLTSVGQDFFIANRGSNSFTLKDFSGNSLSVLTAGQIRYFYLTDNSTQAGTWTSVLFGSVSSNLDASALSGYGIKAIGATLNFAPVTSVISGNTTVATSDRAKVFVWTGGAGTLTLPLASSTGTDFSIEVRNQGSGILTLTPSGSDVIDGSGTVALQVNESCFIHAGVGNWYTVGRGRNTQFNFTQLLKSVTGGTVTLSLTEAANTVQTYSGTLTSNCTVYLPAYVQVYFISNQTSGAFSLSFRTPNTGTTLSLPTGQNAVVFCDGTNVINASTSISGVSSIAFGAGSASNPSASFGTTTNGIYASGTNEVAVSINGVYAGKFSTAGLAVVNALTVGTGLTVTTGGLTVSAGGITATGNSTITGTLGGLTGLTVASGGASIAGNVAVTGALSAEANAAEALTFGSTSRKMYGRADTGGVSLFDGPVQTGNGWYFDTTNNKVKGFISSASKFELSSTGLAVTGDVLPEANGTRALGSTSLRWSQVWCTAGAFNTSDATLKTPIRTMQAQELAAGYQMAQELGTFQWLESVKEKGDKARRHVGLTVQRAAEIMESHGLKPWSYGFMGYDKWDAVTEIVDATKDDEGAYQEEVTRQKTVRQTSQNQTVEIVNGKPVLKAETIETDVPVTEQIQVVDADGNPVFTDVAEVPAVLDVEGNEVTPAIPAHQVPMTHAVPVMETVTVWKRVKEVRPAGESYAFRSDQLNLNISAGLEARIAEQESTITSLIARIEALEARA